MPLRWLLAWLLALCAAAALFALAAPAGAQSSAQRHLELKQLMLELINDARREAGAPDVQLGINAAAQQHAEQMVDGCFHSHWGRDGLKPYMRYSLLGGYQGNAENVRGAARFFGFDQCAVASSVQRPPLEFLVRDAMEAWLQSPGHRRNLLDPAHRLVNIGIAWRGGDAYIFRAVQHFEGDYARLDSPISLAAGVLTLSGRIVNGASLSTGLLIYHDPQPQPQSRLSLAATSAYCGGYPVAAVLPRANWSYRRTTPNCVEPDLGRPRSDGGWINLPIIVAQRWNVGETTFDIRADLSSVLRRYGAGVYTVELSGQIDGARATLLKYALFFGLYPLNSPWVYSAGPTTAAELFERLDLQAVFRWNGAAWRAYAEHHAAPLPGAANFPINPGDWLWLANRN